jgi:hypothetical protein
MEHIDIPGFVFYPGYGMVITNNAQLVLTHWAGLEQQRIGKRTLSTMFDLRQAISSREGRLHLPGTW